MELYKYTTTGNGKNILNNLEIRFTQPNALNDVFEMFPNIMGEIPEIMLKKIYKELEKSGYVDSLWKIAEDNLYKTVKDKFPFLTKRISDFLLNVVFKNHFSKGRTIEELLIDKIKSEPNEFKEKLIREFLNVLNSYVGVLSLSKGNNINLMWSNYADSHRGLILCFDENHQYFKDCNEIRYVKNRSTLNFNDLIPTGKNQDIKEIFMQKGLEWQYEKEVRKFQFLSNNKRILEDTDSYGYPICLFDIPKDTIKGVIFGCKISEKEKEEVKSIIYSKKYDIKFMQAKLSQEEFKLIIEIE